MNYNNYTDIELITLLREGKPSANYVFNLIYLKYSAKFYGFCLYSTGSKEEADELMQDTWMKFYNSIIAGKTTDKILPLLFSIARNIAINNYNHSNKKRSIDLVYFDNDKIEEFADPFGFQSEIEKNELFKMIQIAVNSLDDIYREVMLYYWFGEMKFKDIAIICNENEWTIRKRYERAMKQMDKILKPYLV